jgi:hypothetical protein
MNLNSFSQVDTTKVRIKTPIARLVAKDLIKYDGCKEELKLTQDKILKLQARESQKDTIIALYKDKDENNKFIIHQQHLQINQYEKLTDDLTKEIRSTKNENIFWKITTGIATLLSAVLLVN